MRSRKSGPPESPWHASRPGRCRPVLLLLAAGGDAGALPALLRLLVGEFLLLRRLPGSDACLLLRNSCSFTCGAALGLGHAQHRVLGVRRKPDEFGLEAAARLG